MNIYFISIYIYGLSCIEQTLVFNLNEWKSKSIFGCVANHFLLISIDFPVAFIYSKTYFSLYQAINFCSDFKKYV